MSAPAGCQLVVCWRIVEADHWDRDYLDLCEPAAITIAADGHGEIAFGAMQVTLAIAYAPSSVGFTWIEFDEMDEVSGEGTAELLQDGSSEVASDYHNVGEARPPSRRSGACFNSLLDGSPF
jgi:hypothetical protein